MLRNDRMSAPGATLLAVDGVPLAAGKKVKRTDRRVVRTREALIEAGYALFSGRGLYDVSIDEIVERASVSKQTFYNHFNDKLSLAQSIYLAIRGELELEIARMNANIPDAVARVARGICFYVSKALDDPDHIRFLARMLVQDVVPEDQANRGLMKDLEAGLAAGRFTVRSVDSAVAFVLGASEPLLAAVAADRNRTNALSMSQEFVTLILRGLAVQPMEAELIAAQAANQLIGKVPDNGRVPAP
jgi:AcrR family transcriptional regulator